MLLSQFHQFTEINQIEHYLYLLKMAWIRVDHELTDRCVSLGAWRGLFCGFGWPLSIYPFDYACSEGPINGMILVMDRFYLDDDNHYLRVTVDGKDYYSDDNGVIQINGEKLGAHSILGWKVFNTLTYEIVKESEF